MKATTSILKAFMLVTALFLMNPVHAWEPLNPGYGIRILFTLHEIHPDTSVPRSPVIEPQVMQAGYTLYFLDEADLVLNIYSEDEDGNETLEYTTVVPASTTEIQLPLNLYGSYIIEVVRGEQCFRGGLEL